MAPKALSVVDALKQLDTENDEHWTDNGLPRLDAMAKLCDKQISRAEINQVGAGFSRKNSRSGTATVAPLANGIAESTNDQDADAATLKAATLKELENAEAEMAAATTRKDKAVKAAVQVAAAQGPVTGLQQSENIKRYLKSQADQRMVEGNKRQALAEFLKTMPVA